MPDARDRTEHIAEAVIGLATLANLSDACVGETEKYVADRFAVRMVKPSDITSIADQISERQ